MFQDTFFGDPCSLAALLRRRSWLLEEITISPTMLPLGSSNLLTRVIDRSLDALLLHLAQQHASRAKSDFRSRPLGLPPGTKASSPHGKVLGRRLASSYFWDHVALSV